MPTWEYWHHGAYNTTKVFWSLWPSANDSIWLWSRAWTEPSVQRSCCFSSSPCSVADVMMLPECRPHSLAFESYTTLKHEKTSKWVHKASSLQSQRIEMAHQKDGQRPEAVVENRQKRIQWHSCMWIQLGTYPWILELATALYINAYVRAWDGQLLSILQTMKTCRVSTEGPHSCDHAEAFWKTHLPPPSALSLVLIWQDCSSAWLTSNRHISAAV